MPGAIFTEQLAARLKARAGETYRPANGTEEDRVTFTATGFGFVGKRLASLVDCGTTYQLRGKSKAVTEGFTNVLKYPHA